MVRSLQCLISGKVQGVYYRAWVHGQAVNLGVKGWVRNVADGAVEVLLQGDEAAVQELRGRLMQGSPLSRVEHVETKWLDYDKEHMDFEIRS